MSEGPTKDEQARGGMDYVATMQDGTQQPIFIRQLKVGEWKKASSNWGDEMAMSAIFCSQTQEWVGNLSPESYDTIATEGARINRPFFSYCARTERELINRARVLAPDRLDSLLDGALPKPTSLPTGSRTPLPAPNSP